jgi:outer membrane protein TolC
LIGNPSGTGVTLATGTPLISMPLFDWGQRFAVSRQRDGAVRSIFDSVSSNRDAGVAEASNALVSLDQGRLRLASARAAEEAAETTARGSRAAL